MKKWLVFSMMCLALCSCESSSSSNKTNTDNTGKNVLDQDANAKTADSQSESEADREITQLIRQAIVGDANLSTNAKNIKIITMNGKVTLKGPVNSEAEKAEVEKKVKAVKGVIKVDNQLEIVRR